MTISGIVFLAIVFLLGMWASFSDRARWVSTWFCGSLILLALIQADSRDTAAIASVLVATFGLYLSGIWLTRWLYLLSPGYKANQR